MKFIIEIDGELSTKYKYNIWTAFYYEDGTVSQDERIFASDSLDEFLQFLKELENLKEQ